MKLQGIYGDQPTIKACNLKIGDITVWNYGYKEQVLDIKESKSGKSLKLKILCVDSNKEMFRTLRKERLVVLA